MILLRSVMFAWLAAGCGREGFDSVAGERDASPSDSDAIPDTLGTGDTAGTGTPALMQAGPAAFAMNGITVTLATPSTPGTLLVATIGSNGVNPVGLPPSWVTAAMIGTSGGCYTTLAFEPDNPGGVTSVTFTQGANIPIVAQLTEWSGAATSSPLDAVGTQVSTSPTTSQVVQTSSVTSVAGEVAVDVFCEDVNAPTYTPGGGWTNLGSYSNTSSAPSFTSDFQLGLAPGTIGETQTSSVNGKYSAIIATFRP